VYVSKRYINPYIIIFIYFGKIYYIMTVSIAIDSKFKHLNADRSYAIKVGGVGVEKELVCNITLVDEDLSDAVIGQFIADFTQVGLKQVYSCEIVAQDNHVSTFDFIPHATSDAALARFHVTDRADGLVNDGADLPDTVLKVVVRGV
jgi:hypothetical protein